MGWVSDARLVAATSTAGGCGILGSATMTLDELRRSIDQVQEATPNPFGVNFRSDNPEVEEVVDLLIERRVRVASFASTPTPQLIGRLREAGVLTIPSVGALRHAQKVAEWGVDALIVQGGEGGGHTGSVPTSLLLPQVVDAVEIPVVAAGGYFDGRGLAAALVYGAAGIAMGTRFLLTRESPVPQSMKALYLARTVADTVVTTAVDGAPLRVIRTPLIHDLQPDASDLIRAGLVDGDEDGVLPAGQVVGLIDDIPSVQELIDRIMEGATERFGQLGALGRG